MKKMWNFVLAMSRPVLLGIVGVLVVLALMLFQLNSLTPGLSAPEVASYEAANSVSDIVNNTVNAPYKTAVFMVTKIINNNFGLRLVSALLGALSIGIFYLLARRLFTPLIAAAATAMFATSSLLLHVSRLGTADVMLLSLLALFAVGFLLRFNDKYDIIWPLTAVVVCLTLYVPGMLFFVIPAVVWQFWHVKKSFEQVKPITITICATLIGFLLAPLVISLVREPSLWRGYLGMPTEFAPLMDMVRAAGRGVASLFILASFDPVYWLGRTPILDVLSTVLFLYGVLELIKQYRLDRFWIMLGIAVLTIVLIGVTGNQMLIVLLLPFVYIMIGLGLYHLMSLWLGVFPRNPIARYTGVIIMGLAICLAINFQLQRYFVAWPNNSDTKAAFSLSLP